ncbi:MAG: hypothetical protein K8F24_12780 [Bacteroidales bacterium]|nr:hypothetical protein [Bacteroidales bacterium]
MKHVRLFSLILLFCLMSKGVSASSSVNEGYANKGTEINTQMKLNIESSEDDSVSKSINVDKRKAGFVQGYRGFVETGFNVENGTEGDYNWLKVNFINAYQFNPGFMLGIGLGLRNNLKRGKYLFPLFVALRAQFPSKKKFEPFFSFYGYNIIPEFPLNEGGYFISPQIGLDMKLGRKSSAYFGVGVELKKGSRNSWHYWYGPTEMHKDFFHYSFMLGFSF